jgi:hypothetical protein
MKAGGKFLQFVGLFALAVSANAGPLGLNMGQTVAQTKIVKALGSNNYSVSVPNPLNSFENYLAKIGQKIGLCRLIAVGRTFENDAYGSNVSGEYGRLKELIFSKYGASKEFDFLQAGSIWNEPKDWSMAVMKDERSKSSFWDRSEGSNLPPDIEAINLKVLSANMNENYVVITYEFKNFEQCKQEENNLQRDAL